MLKKLWHRMVNSATHEIRKQNEELKSQILKNDAEIRSLIQQFGDESVAKINDAFLQNNNEILSKIVEKELKNNEQFHEIENSFSQIQDFLNRVEANQKILENKQLIFETQTHYKYVREQILEKLSHGEKLRFGSYVIYDSTFGAHGICELMLKEPEKYDVQFVICPDVYRDMAGLRQYHKTKQFFIERYGADKVLDGYDEKTGEFLDWSDSFDVVYTANPYDVLVNKVHGIRYLSSQNVLPIFICYGYIISNWFMKEFVASQNAALLYKNFVGTKQTKMEAIEFQNLYTRNIVLSGYPKMDKLEEVPESKHSRKKILIAPHHTVKGLPGELQLSNFLEYADLIPELADMFPNIDFVFRPHPLLFTNLMMHGIWSQDKVDSYLENLREKNIAYSTESDYLHLFKECDAIVHDCGSYSVEWLYTGKPCCYVVDSEERVRKQLNKLANFALDCHTEIADSKEKIISFIKKVENDEYQEKLNERVRSDIMVNYPNCSEFILKSLLR